MQAIRYGAIYLVRVGAACHVGRGVPVMIAGNGDGALKWKTLSSRETYRCGVFTVHERRSQGPDGRVGTFSVLSAKDWAVVVPYVRKPDGDCFLMVRQYRHGADQVSLEFPGGVVEPGEDPLHAASRELSEETGWMSDTILHAGTVFPNPAIQDNRFHVFVALDPRPAVARNLDEHEIIDAHLMPVEEIRRAMGEGEMRHALMVTALFLAERLLAGLPGSDTSLSAHRA